MQVVHGLASRYEAYHKVAYTPGALAAAVDLTVRYVADRQLPDKAIDVLDEAGSAARIAAYHARRSSDGEPNLRLAQLAQVRENGDCCAVSDQKIQLMHCSAAHACITVCMLHEVVSRVHGV